jgi:nucleoside-diphosphate-sugar epimerase
MNQKPRVVITGVAGFIGSNLAYGLLSQGYQVIGIDDLSSGLQEQVPEGVEFEQLDIRSPELISRFRPGDIVFHLGAKSSVSDAQSDPVAAASVNVVGTVNVFDAALKAGVEKVIYAETSAIYEGSTRLPTPETEIAPHTFYAISKYATRFFAEGYERFHHMRLTALRYFNVYGPRQDYRRSIPPVMCAFILNLLQGRPATIYGDGNKRRDFVYVDDVNAFHMRCMLDPNSDGQIYNLGSGSNYSIREIYDSVQALLNTKIEPIYKPDLPGEAIETLADISAARRLGWEPRVGLNEGLRISIDYIRDNVLPSLGRA